MDGSDSMLRYCAIVLLALSCVSCGGGGGGGGSNGGGGGTASGGPTEFFLSTQSLTFVSSHFERNFQPFKGSEGERSSHDRLELLKEKCPVRQAVAKIEKRLSPFCRQGRANSHPTDRANVESAEHLGHHLL
jgi:hypothetical protein